MRVEVVRWCLVALVLVALTIGIVDSALGDTVGGDLRWISLQLIVAAAFILSVHVAVPVRSRLAAVNDAVAMALFIYVMNVFSVIGDAGLDAALTAPLSRPYLPVLLAALVLEPLFRTSMPSVIGGDVARLARELAAKLAFAVLIALALRLGVTDPSLANLRAFVATTAFFFMYRSFAAPVVVIGRIRADQIAPVLLVAVCLFDPTGNDWQIELGILAAIGLFALIRRLWPVPR